MATAIFLRKKRDGRRSTKFSDAFSRGLLYLTDQDARPLGSASPIAHLWDTGSNDLDGLSRVMAVRAAALKNLSESAIPEHTPMATLEDVLVPMYLYHRYQVTAVAKSIGGLDYSFNLRGIKDNERRRNCSRRRAASFDSCRARHALAEVLALPEPLLKMIPPRPRSIPLAARIFRAARHPHSMRSRPRKQPRKSSPMCSSSPNVPSA
jgi:hypothetical protein